MAEGRSAALWSHTASLMALTANIHRDPKKRPFGQADFNPHINARRKNKGVDAAEWRAALIREAKRRKR